MTEDIELSKRVSQLESKRDGHGDRLLIVEGNISTMNSTLTAIKDNHLTHIETAMKDMNSCFIEMKTTMKFYEEYINELKSDFKAFKAEFKTFRDKVENNSTRLSLLIGIGGAIVGFLAKWLLAPLF